MCTGRKVGAEAGLGGEMGRWGDRAMEVMDEGRCVGWTKDGGPGAQRMRLQVAMTATVHC